MFQRPFHLVRSLQKGYWNKSQAVEVLVVVLVGVVQVAEGPPPSPVSHSVGENLVEGKGGVRFVRDQ